MLAWRRQHSAPPALRSWHDPIVPATAWSCRRNPRPKDRRGRSPSFRLRLVCLDPDRSCTSSSLSSVISSSRAWTSALWRFFSEEIWRRMSSTNWVHCSFLVFTRASFFTIFWRHFRIRFRDCCWLRISWSSVSRLRHQALHQGCHLLVLGCTGHEGLIQLFLWYTPRSRRCWGWGTTTRASVVGRKGTLVGIAVLWFGCSALILVLLLVPIPIPSVSPCHEKAWKQTKRCGAAPVVWSRVMGFQSIQCRNTTIHLLEGQMRPISQPFQSPACSSTLLSPTAVPRRRRNRLESPR